MMAMVLFAQEKWSNKKYLPHIFKRTMRYVPEYKWRALITYLNIQHCYLEYMYQMINYSIKKKEDGKKTNI